MINIPQKVEYVINKLLKNGYEAYIVGGCVRDSLMGIEPHDYDITTSATPETVQNLFRRTIPTGLKHGTVTVLVENTPIEVTTFRNESGYNDSRHPDSVSFVTDLKEDLSRRDFTVNAIAYNSKKGIADYFGGVADIKSRTLRAVGNPNERFNEDALRILRLFRFSATLNFICEQNTLTAAIETAENLKNISSERIFAELFKAVTGENFKAFAPLIESKALEFLKIEKLPDFDIIRQAETPELAFFLFLYYSSTDILETLNILKTSNKLKDYCTALLELIFKDIPATKPEIKRLLTAHSPETVFDYLELKKLVAGTDIADAKRLLKIILRKGEPYLIRHLDINGEALKNIGYQKEEIGIILRKLQQLVIEHPEKNKCEMLLSEISQ